MSPNSAQFHRLILDAQNKYTAFIDLFDVLSYVVEVLNLPLEPSEDWIVSDSFQNTSCLTLVGRSQRSAWMLIGEDTPLQAAVNSLTEVHRLAVVDSQGNLTSVLTQSRVVHWLANRSEWVMGDIATMSVDDFRLGYGDVVTVNHNEKTINGTHLDERQIGDCNSSLEIDAAFLKMYKMNVSGVAVVDDSDTVIGNISVSDLKDIGYGANMFRKLYVSCGTFLNRKIEGGLVPKLVYANRSTTIKEMLDRFRDNRCATLFWN
jgi:CBS domain-containing protein